MTLRTIMRGTAIGQTDFGAVFSDNRRYRYVLWRRFNTFVEDGPLVVFIGLNPSTATEHVDDPTIRRCIGFAKDWGCVGMVMMNAFAFRATDPKEMKKADEPFGPENGSWLKHVCTNIPDVSRVVCCWGSNGVYKYQGESLRSYLRNHDVTLHHFGLTSTGQPKHPLYLPKDSRLKIWEDG